MMNYLYVFAAAFLFSSMEVAIKFTGGAFNPVQLNFIRFLVAGLLLYPISRRELSKLTYTLAKKDYLHFAFTGFLCIVVSMTFYTLSVSFLDAHVAGVLFCANTFFSMLLAHFFTEEKMNRPMLFAVCLAFVGFIVLINPLHFQGSLPGVVIVLISALSFSFYALVGKILYKDAPFKAATITSRSFLFGVAELFVLILISRTAPVSGALKAAGLDVFANIPILHGIQADNILILLYISVFVTGLGFASHLFAVETNPVAVSSLVFFVKPVLSPIMAALFLGDTIYKNEIVGILLIAVASGLILSEQHRREQKKAAA
ncbi:DMT family transporter [Aedoeadaptatus pacaensis]|uniref:DMT family transporter n=1 Tax=Aedoeadaptatus pacaensis TaxID=1776390 RepID=UPI000B083C8B|nr:DMT family transporter [Peptoniphilus pacaensis]